MGIIKQRVPMHPLLGIHAEIDEAEDFAVS
jgi:hypothetical protein